VFPDIGFVVTGGVGPDNASAFAAAGAAGLAFGGSIEAVLDDPAPALAAASSITDPWVMQPIERMAT
jgi:2-keto-3-deoxy-6-phosphogluconate aldolase